MVIRKMVDMVINLFMEIIMVIFMVTMEMVVMFFGMVIYTDDNATPCSTFPIGFCRCFSLFDGTAAARANMANTIQSTRILLSSLDIKQSLAPETFIKHIYLN